MERYLLASDLDGTLIKHNDGPNNQRTVLKKDKVSLEQFIEKGNIFILCTGRDKVSTFKLFERENIMLNNTYFITSNGAEIYTSDRKCIYKKSLEEKITRQVLDIFLTTKNVNLECRMFDGEIERTIESLEDYYKITEPVINICVFSKRNEISDAQDFYQLINGKLKQVEITMNNWYVDIIPIGISKASSIQYVLNMQKDSNVIKIVAIGDSWNDISMFKLANQSYTFNNSPENVKAEADYTVDHFYQAIETIMGKDKWQL